MSKDKEYSQFNYATTSLYHRGCGSAIGGWGYCKESLDEQKAAKAKAKSKGVKTSVDSKSDSKPNSKPASRNTNAGNLTLF